MIVDLMRNDIGRISEIGSVSVSDLFTVETFRTLHQMTSGVRATLKQGCRARRAARRDISAGLGDRRAEDPRHGADPRLRDRAARRLLRGHRPTSRPRARRCSTSPSARPVIFRDGRGEMGIGSGVVYDSEGAKEYAECLLKMKFLTDPPKRFELIETLLHDGKSGYWLLERHIERLKATAQYFNFAFDEAM